MIHVYVSEPKLTGSEEAFVSDCVKTAWISSSGKYIREFEEGWAAYCGRKYGVAVSNGTVALELAVSALDLPAGGEVIVPTFTIVSCLEAILRNGLKPVLVDCDRETYCMDVDAMEHSITRRTVAVMPVHIYGHPVNMDKMKGVVDKHGIRVVEDAAEAHGSECLVDNSWKRCGSFGDVSCFSFYANKNITCGEGGMVLTDDPSIAEKLRSRRNLCFGKSDRFMHEDRGHNFRITNMQAALGCAQIKRIDDILERKREISRMYTSLLKELPLVLPTVKEWARSSVWMYAVLLGEGFRGNARSVMRSLESTGIETRSFFVGMHEQKVYNSMGLFLGESYPVTEMISRRGFYLPTGQALTNEQIYFVVDKLKEVMK